MNLVGALALALADRMQDATEAAAGQGATAPAALVALYEFLDHGTMDQLRLAVGLTPSGAVRLVDRLVRVGYVQRQPGPDRRSVAVVLTSRGKKAALQILAARSAALDSVLAELSAAERTSLSEIAGTLLGVIAKRRIADREEGNDPGGGWLCRLCDLDACGRDRGTCPAAEAASK